jgi:hypothetical protein
VQETARWHTPSFRVSGKRTASSPNRYLGLETREVELPPGLGVCSQAKTAPIREVALD